ncbi:MAG: hypothetical protein WCO26_20700 [Deltaproteobacteria bacterium]
MTHFGMWIDLLDEGIPLLFLIALGLAFFRGFRKNHALLTEREELLKRYLLFRGEKQVRLKVFGEDDKAYQELLKTISNSWKTFKKASDQYLVSLAQNTTRTRLFLQIITLGLLVNSIRILLADYLFFGPQTHLFYTVARELSSYVLVVLCFALLRMQTRRFLPAKGKAVEMDREVLFFPNGQPEGESEHLHNEFDPLESSGGDDGKEDHDSGRGTGG